MKSMRSQLTDTVTVHAGEVHLAIAPGDVVDLGRVVAPGLTLEDALGPHAAAFVPVETAAAKLKFPTRAARPSPVDAKESES